MGILSYLFLLTFLTFPLGQVVRFQFPGNVNVSLFDFSVLLTGGIYLLLQLRGTKRYESYSLTGAILLFFGTVLLSLVVNLFRYPWSDLAIAFLYAVRWLLFASMYFIVREQPESLIKKIPSFLTIVGAAVVGIGYIQYAFYPNLRNLYYMGWDEHYIRMFSSFFDPNFAGAFFTLYFLFLLGRMYEKKLQWNLWNITHCVLLVFTFIAIFLSTSRSAFIMLFVGLFTYLILIRQKKWILLFLGIAALIVVFSSPLFYIENLNPFRVTSSLARVETAQNALQIISRNTVFGVGFNAYRYAQVEYGFRAPSTLYPNHADSGTDNSFLFVWATTGIVGLLAYLYLMYRIFRLGKKHEQSVMGKILIASIVGLAVNSLFINSLFFPPLMYWLWVTSGLTDYT